MKVQPITQNRVNSLNFSAKMNIQNKYVFDAKIIENFAAVDNGVLLSLKEFLYTKKPTSSSLYYHYKYRLELLEKYTSMRIVTKDKPNKIGGKETVIPTEYKSVATAENTRLALETFDNQYWSEYRAKQIFVDVPFESFVEQYKKAIKSNDDNEIIDV